MSLLHSHEARIEPLGQHVEGPRLLAAKQLAQALRQETEPAVSRLADRDDQAMGNQINTGSA